MEHSIRVTTTFDAGHVDNSRIRCQRHHGHRFEAAVEKRIGGDFDLEADLAAVTLEWHLRDMCEMLHAKSVSIETIATNLAERLLLRHPSITRVEVGDGVSTAVVSQEYRR